MNIKRIIDQNNKLILYVVLIIIFVLYGIRFLNSYYEQNENKKSEELSSNINNTSNSTQQHENEEYSTTESNSVEVTINSFVNYCNKREISNAYKMLTDDCKNAMFPSMEEFEKRYVNNIFNVVRTYELTKWATNGEISTYLVNLYGDLLSTGNTENYTQDYYTLIKNDNGIYQLNINGFIYRINKNEKTSVKNIEVMIDYVDIYEEYEEATITITNNTNKTICLTGNKYGKNIYLQNLNGVEYSSLNSEFDEPELLLKTKETQTFTVEFNKVYNPYNKAIYLVLNDIILDYEEYLNSTNKANYQNRTNIKLNY